ncbi:MAG: DUF2079 domain-containing protein [Actinokineospora sp.]
MFLLLAVAAVPVGLAAVQGLRTTRLHLLLDYWHVLAKITTDTGSLLPDMVATYHLEQPFVLPGVLFWLDARLLGGDNRALTALTLVLLVGIVALLWSMLPRGLGALPRAALTAGFAFLLFTPHAVELWVQATNGISWVPAVFFAVLAIALAHRGRAWASYSAAVVGTLSFGAALPVWFAIALVAWLRRERPWMVVAPVAIGVVVIGAWLATRPVEPASLATSAFDPSGRLAVVAASLGSLWTSKNADLAVIAGGVLAIMLALLTWSAIQRRRADSVAVPTESGWVGLACYSVAIAVLIGLGRTTTAAVNGNIGLVSRYSIVAALATCAALTLVYLHRPVRARLLVAGVLALGLVTHALGAPKAADVRRAYAPLGVAAVALRVEAPRALAELRVQPGILPAAKAMGMYPFGDGFTLGCGGRELGDRTDPSAIRALPDGGGVVDTPVTGDAVLSGWAGVNGRPADCVLVLDATGVVVGGGIRGLDHPGVPGPLGGQAGWRAVARPGSIDPIVVVVSDNVLYRVPTSLTGP